MKNCTHQRTLLSDLVSNITDALNKHEHISIIKAQLHVLPRSRRDSPTYSCTLFRYTSKFFSVSNRVKMEAINNIFENLAGTKTAELLGINSGDFVSLYIRCESSLSHVSKGRLQTAVSEEDDTM